MRRERALARALATAAVVAAASSSADASAESMAALTCGGSAGDRLRVLDAPASGSRIAVASKVPPNAFLLLEERGVELEWRIGDAGYESIATRPPRYGIVAMPVREGMDISIRSVDPSRPVRASAWLDCSGSTALASLSTCTAGDASSLALPDASVGSPDSDAGSMLCNALREHSAATRASKDGAPGDSAHHYRRAIEAWERAGYAGQRAAAELGLAEQLLRRGQHRDGLDRAMAAESAFDRVGDAYYAARARALQCIELRHLGNADEALSCQREVPGRFEAAGEASEAVNAYASWGAQAFGDGLLQDAATAMTRGRALARTSVIGPLASGRLELLAASVHAADGRFSDAIVAMDAALQRFENAGDERWQANAYLRAAELYRELGALPEAQVFAHAALARLESGDAPARLAAARLALGKILLAAGDRGAAMPSLRRARELYAATDMPLEVAAVDVLLLDAGDEAAREQVVGLERHADTPPRLRSRGSLALAASDLRHGRAGEASRRLEGIAAHGGDLGLRIDVVVLAGRVNLALGRPEPAMREAAALMDEIGRFTSEATSMALRHLAERSLGNLRELWVDAYFAQTASRRPDMDVVWNVVWRNAMHGRSSSDTGPRARSNRHAVDQALALALLEDAAPAPVIEHAQREILRHMPADPRSAYVAGPSWNDILAHASGDAGMLALALGRDNGIAFVIEHGRARVIRLADPNRIRVLGARLLERVEDVATPVATIVEDAKALGALLLVADGMADHSHWQIVADESLGMLPFAVLHLPGDERPWIERSSLTIVTGIATTTDSASSWPPTVNVLAAAGGAGGGEGLGALANAEVEARHVRRALGGRTDVAEVPGTRKHFMERLGDPGGMVHVAAHGASRHGLQGFSGIWFEPEYPGDAGFTSWLTVLDATIRSNLVVLNACDLAQRADSEGSGEVGFAQALSAAGARHVIASRWPLSDAAAAKWSSAFYARLASEPDMPVAAALREAQLSLLASRMFRHPYYWSSLVHFERRVFARD